MKLEKVTITGADDLTDIAEMIVMSEEFPFLEWGILVSANREGTPRFPSRDWIGRLCSHVDADNLALSTHLCGGYVRDLLMGNLEWNKIPACIRFSRRIQINTHGQPHISTVAMMDNLQQFRDRQIIFQFDGINDHLAFAARMYGINACALFDRSAGAGITPPSWPSPINGIHCGFAGGLSPTNVLDQCELISKNMPEMYHTWIDMEAKVRSDDGSFLDVVKVRSILQQIKNSHWLQI